MGDRGMARWIALILLGMSGLLLAGCGPKKDKVPDRTNPVNYVALRNVPGITPVGYTGSMEPYLHGGEFLDVRAVPFGLIRPHMLVEFYWPGRQLNVIHEVMTVSNAANGEAYLVTKGFANAERDPHVVTPDLLIGVAVAVNGHALPERFVVP